MREAREIDGGAPPDATSREELTLTLLRGFVHDLASPLAVLTSNLPVVRGLPIGEGSEAGEQAARELAEIVDDLELATARLRELTNDLRLYVGACSHDKTFEDLVLTALRLAHAQLGRRVDVALDIDSALAPAGNPQHVLRAVSETLVAISAGLPTSPRSALTVRADAGGATIELAPAPAVDPTATIEAALRPLRVAPDVRRSPERLTIHVALPWAARSTR